MSRKPEGHKPGDIVSEVRAIGPDEALELTTSHKFSRQRNLDNKHAEKLGHCIETRTFLPGTSVEIAVVMTEKQGVWVEGKHVLTDGQHRLTAVFMTDQAQQFTVITRYCSSWEEVDAIYYNTDAGKSRSITDVLRAADLHKDTGLTASQMKAVVSAAQYIASGVPGVKQHMYSRFYAQTNDEKLETLVEWSSAAVKYFEQVKGGERLVTQRMDSVPAVIVGLLSMKHQPLKAAPFWKAVAHNSGLEKGTPEHTLVRLFLENRVNDLGVGLYVRKIATTWNHYMQGTGITYIKGIDQETPLVLKGIPGFDGKK